MIRALFPKETKTLWHYLIKPKVLVMNDAIILNRPLIFSKTKDRPVVITALAADADWLLTLDIGDFQKKLGDVVYSVRIGTPADFLIYLRVTGHL